MPRPNLYLRTEQRFGKPMIIILTRLLNRGGYKTTARWLHVHPITILKWAKLAGVTTCYVAASDCADAPSTVNEESRCDTSGIATKGA